MEMVQRIKVTRKQFMLLGDSVIHEPTGSWLVAYSKMPDPCRTSIYRDVLLNGVDYSPDEIMDIGSQLLRERLFKQVAVKVRAV